MVAQVQRANAVVIWRETFPAFEYHRPKTVGEALELLSRYAGEAKVFAGGTCLTRDLRAMKVAPKHVIDIKGIRELRRIRYVEGEGLEIGATVTYEDVLSSSVIKEKFRALWDAAKQMGDVQVRHRGTIGGNIANSSPQADSPPALLVMGAWVTLASVRGTRKVMLKEFFKGHKKNVMEPDELLVSIHVPEPPEGARSAYIKFKRSAEDRAIVGVAALVASVRDRERRVVRLAYSSIAKTPVLLEEAEELFRQDRPFNELVEEAVKLAQSRFDLPVGERGIDLRVRDEYRLHLIRIGTKAILKYLVDGVEVF